MSNGDRFMGLQGNPPELQQQYPQGQLVSDIVNREERAAKLKAEAMEHISPIGSPPCRMPRLLNERRERYLIIDEMFQYPAMYDRILVHQVSRHAGETKGGGKIIMPDATRDREKDSANLGIIVSAGLRALDELESNGSGVGHLIAFVQWSVYRIPIATIGGKDWWLLVLKAGDIVADCDLQRLRNEQEVRVVPRKLEDGSRQHVHVDSKGELWLPEEPFTSEI